MDRYSQEPLTFTGGFKQEVWDPPEAEAPPNQNKTLFSWQKKKMVGGLGTSTKPTSHHRGVLADLRSWCVGRVYNLSLGEGYHMISIHDSPSSLALRFTKVLLEVKQGITKSYVFVQDVTARTQIKLFKSAGGVRWSLPVVLGFILGGPWVGGGPQTRP